MRKHLEAVVDEDVLVAGTAKPGRPRRRGRSILSAVIITLACVLGPLAVAAVWVSDEVGSTSRWVQTMAPLASNADVQAAATNRITDVVVQQTNLESTVADATKELESATSSFPKVSGLLGTVSGAVTGQVTSFVHTVVQKVVESDQFKTLWTEANRAAHGAAVKLLTGEGGVLKGSNGQVSVDLGPVVEQVKNQLVANGFGLASHIPAVHTDFVIAQTSSLEKARSGFRLLQILGDWLPLALALMLALGIWLARYRRRALIRAAIGLVIGMAVLGIGLTIGRHIYLDKLPDTVSKPAAGAIYDQLVGFLRVSLRTIAALALVVAIGAFFTGPSGFAAAVRSLCATTLDRARALTAKAGFGPGPVDRWVHQYRRWVAYAAVVLAVVWYVLLAHPTVKTVAWLTFGVLLVLALLEFLDPTRVRLQPVVASGDVLEAAGGSAAVTDRDAVRAAAAPDSSEPSQPSEPSEPSQSSRSSEPSQSPSSRTSRTSQSDGSSPSDQSDQDPH
jgi:hypothetical protein